VICYLEPCNGSLPISSGTLVLHDPAIQSDVRVLIGYPAVAEIAYLLSEHDVAGLEVTLEKLKCTRYSLVGRVGVDSATIVIGDQASIESCPSSVLFLRTRKENLQVTQKLESRFKLETRRLIDETAEVLTNDPADMYRLLSDYVASELSLDPTDYLSYYPEDGYHERCLEAAWDGGIFYACRNRLFIFSTGSDGSFDVVAGYSDERIIKIWLLLQDGLFQDGKVNYTLKPLETRPPKKPPSPAFIAKMKESLDAQKGYSNITKKRPWWKIW
jgi:hypothetical protein